MISVTDISLAVAFDGSGVGNDVDGVWGGGGISGDMGNGSGWGKLGTVGTRTDTVLLLLSLGTETMDKNSVAVIFSLFSFFSFLFFFGFFSVFSVSVVVVFVPSWTDWGTCCGRDCGWEFCFKLSSSAFRKRSRNSSRFPSVDKFLFLHS